MRVKSGQERRSSGASPEVTYEPRPGRWLDLAAAAVSLLFLAPLLLVIMAALRLERRGPLIKREERIGLQGRRFHVLRFDCSPVSTRTAGAKPDHLPPQPISTLAAHVLHARLDGLPQLWNVLRGEMSLVGPMPIREADLIVYGGALRTCWSVRPGLVHPAAAARARSMEVGARIRFESHYADHKSFMGDLRVLAAFIPRLLLGDGSKADALGG